VTTLASRLLGWPLFVKPHHVSIDAMGTTCLPARRRGFDEITEAVRIGFNLVLETDDDPVRLGERLDAALEPGLRGFAHEGVGMGLAILDWFTPWAPGRFQAYYAHRASSYDVTLVLGAGFAFARVPVVLGGLERFAERHGRVHDGLVLNGYGFHQALFKSGGAAERWPLPRGLPPALLRAVDNGVGRALWFLCGMEPPRMQQSLARLAPARHLDLWTGLGTACCYAGRAFPDLAEHAKVLEQLEELVGPHRKGLAAGVILAAMVQRRASSQTPWAAQAAERFVGASHETAALRGEEAWKMALAAPGPGFAAYRVFIDALAGLETADRRS